MNWLLATFRRAAWAPIAVYLLHLGLSRFGGYAALPRIDMAMHFVGGVVIAWFFHVACQEASRAGLLAPFHFSTHAIMVFGLTALATVVWEFYEFVSDRYLSSHAQGNVADTLRDQLLGLLGGILMIAVLKAASRK